MNSFINPLFIAALVMILSSIVIFQRKNSWGIFMLLIGAFLLRLWASQLSPFLHLWDEQFHALVAKNMASDMLKPILMPDIAPYSEMETWVSSHLWLHKQPFFLWLMALSIKVFGATEFAVRFPTVLMGTLAVFGVYRIGKNLISSQVGFLAAFLMTTSYISINLSSGMETTDHNDAIFVSLITCSFWFYSEYFKTKNRYWVFLIGLAIGCAMLTKWLTGLLVFAPWFLILLIEYKDRRGFVDFSLALLVSLVVFLPWQVYAYVNYTDIYLLEIEYNGRHFYEVIEGHGGDVWYHFEKMRFLYFKENHFILTFVLLISFVTIWLKTRSIKILLFIVIPIIFVYLFFTLAATKMPLFTFMVSPLVYIATAVLFVFIGERFSRFIKNNFLRLGLVLFIFHFLGFHHLRYTELQNNHDLTVQEGWTYVVLKTKEQEAIIELKEKVIKENEDYIIFNTRPHSHPSFTFYTGYAAYDFVPSLKDLQQNIEDGYTPIILRTKDIPEELMQVPEVIFYDFPYWD